MAKNHNYSLLPNVALLKIFEFSKLEDLYSLQQACPKFKQLIEDLKRKEIENDWRLNYLKYEKFGKEISASGALKSLKMAKTKKGGKYSIYGRFAKWDEVTSVNVDPIDGQFVSWGDYCHHFTIFTEVSNY